MSDKVFELLKKHKTLPSEVIRVLEHQADEIERLRDAVLFFAKHYDGPPDNMLTTWEQGLFQVPDEIKSPPQGKHTRSP